MSIKTIGILRGGKGDHYQTSLKKGGDIISYIQEHLSSEWKPVDILVDKDGVWHLGGLPITPISLSHRVDEVWNFSHPTLSQVLNNFSIPNTSTNSFASVLESNRKVLEEHMKGAGVNMPRSVQLPSYKEDIDGPKDKYAFKKARMILAKFPPTWIVRSSAENKDINIHIAKTFSELVDAIENAISHGENILVEELIAGKLVYTHSIAGFRGEDLYHLPAKEIKGESERKNLFSISKNIYNHTGANNYLKCNFIINPKRGVFLTSIELFPDLRENSHFAKACAGVSTKGHHVLKHILEKTLNQ